MGRCSTSGDVSPDELAYNYREEGRRDFVTDDRQYKTRAFNDGTVIKQGVKKSMVKTNGRRDKSELVGREDGSRGVEVCNRTLENDQNTAASLPGEHRQQHGPDQKAEHGRNHDLPEAHHAEVDCLEIIGVIDKLQGGLKALEK